MPSLKQLVTIARVVAIVALAAVVLKVAPTLAQHAAGHSGTYAGAAAPVVRGH